MTEYIKKANVFEAYSDWLSTYDIGFDCAHNLWVNLDEIPIEAVVEREKGKWELSPDSSEGACTICNYKIYGKKYYGRYWIVPYNFCPNCGADMRGEDDG